jgi:hypothetical protein
MTAAVYFFLTKLTITKYNDSIYQLFPLSNGMVSTSIGGNSEYETYIGGWDLNNNKTIPKIGKWNGSGITDIPVIDASGKEYSITSVYAVSNDEIWFGGDSGRLLSYINNNFTFYQFDSTYAIYPLLVGQNNKLIICAYKLILSPNGNDGILYYDFFEKNYENWIKIWSKTYHNEYAVAFRPIKDRLLGIKQQELYKFINNDFVFLKSFVGFKLSTLYDGISENEFMIYGSNVNSNRDIALLHWNGVNWSYEISLENYDNMSTHLKSIGNRYYFGMSGNYFLDTYIFKGRKK